ncbi:MAG: ATP-binding protein [Kiritimatiellae bacterium]|nr:ATP-binding protein [Kiritimatiellia bacterium]
MTKDPAKYDESNIQTLDPLEHIRQRTGMYIGRKGDGAQYEDGIYILLKEVLDNAIDEFVMGFGKRVVIRLNYQTGKVTIRDYGRGIPLGKVIDCVSQMNTGGKYNDDVFQFSVGMNGVGTKAVNALSQTFLVRSQRDGKFVEAAFERGKLVNTREGESKERNGTFVEFIPDIEIFTKFAFREEHVQRRLKMYAYLNAGLTLDLNGEQYCSEAGLVDLINAEAGMEQLYEPICFRSKKLEIAFTHSNHMGEDYYSFVNGQYTNDGGTHLTAFKEGFLKGVQEFAKKRYEGDVARDGIIAAIAIRLKEPVFESQTKNKLGNPEIRAELVAEVKKIVEDELHRHPEDAQRLLNKIEETSKIRAELKGLQKTVRERAKQSAVRVEELVDCKLHYDKQKGKGEDTMLFLVEGKSAGGTVATARDTQTQAVFKLRGKPLNVCDLKRDAIYKNKEFYDLVKTLGIEQTPDTLRYGKIILATDADVDGLHIRNLLITFFLRFFDHIIKDGRLFILETPLFRVRNAKQSFYCYTDEEREKAIKTCGAKAEITRVKGLGEINAKEFKDFIGENIRLTPVNIHNDVYVQETLRFFMGTNTQERRQYILSNLVVDNTDV